MSVNICQEAGAERLHLFDGASVHVLVGTHEMLIGLYGSAQG